MISNLFSLREEEIFNTLNELRGKEFCIIGGYAVNAYALPRFSVDCDIVIKDKNELKRIEKNLIKIGYKKIKLQNDIPYSGSFSRYEKTIVNNFAVSMDILVGSVADRMTGTVFSADWVFDNSSAKILKGKTIFEELKLRIINIDALLVMKMVSCRSTDIRDVFMMFPKAKDKEWIMSEIQLRYDIKDRFKRIIEKVSSKQFKDGLSGVYGHIEEKVFEKHRNAIIKFSSVKR